MLQTTHETVNFKHAAATFDADPHLALCIFFVLVERAIRLHVGEVLRCANLLAPSVGCLYGNGPRTGCD